MSGAALSWKRTAIAAPDVLQTKRLGVMMPGTEAMNGTWVKALVTRLGELGLAQGAQFHIEYRWAAGDAANYAPMAGQLIASAPDVILCPTTGVTLAVQRATRTIPIVFVLVSDPVGLGIVSNLARPGGNTTGFSWLDFSVAGKALELLKTMVPGLGRIGLLFNPQTAPQGAAYVAYLTATARRLSVSARPAPAADEAGIEAALGELATDQSTGLIVLSDPFTGRYQPKIIAAAAAHKLPAIYFSDTFPRGGGLASYGPSETDQFREAATYISRILHGSNPGDLPVQQPTKFQLVINLKTAKALGLTIPPTLLARADEVIE